MTHRQLRTVTAILAICSLAAGGAASRAVAAQVAAGGDTPMRDFTRSSDYVLVAGGKQVPADIYMSQRVGGMLIISSSLTSPVLLMPATNLTETVNLMKVDKKADGSIDLLPGAVLAQQGALEYLDDIVHFKVDGKPYELRQTPPLLGLHRAEEVTDHNPEYAPRAAAYQPSAAAVAALRKEPRAVRLRVYFGSWCPHCREMVPHIIKVEQQLKGSNVHIEYYGLPPHFGTDAVAKQNAIQGVPTGIVYLGDKEIGRIVGLSWNSPETMLVQILKGGKS